MHISDLPPELLHHIMSYLSNTALVQAMCAAPRLFVVPQRDLARRKWIAQSFVTLAERGDLEGLRYKYQFYKARKFFINPLSLQRAVEWASAEGHLAVVRYAQEEIFRSLLAPAAIDWACRSGHLPVVEYLHNIGYAATNMGIIYACDNGHLHIIEYLHHKAYFHIITAAHIDAMNLACENGHLALVQYLHRTVGLHCTAYAMDRASRNGHLGVVQYLHGSMHAPHTLNTPLTWASENGHLAVVQYLHETVGCACTARAMDDACKNGHLAVVQYLCRIGGDLVQSNAMNNAIVENHVEIVQFLHSVARLTTCNYFYLNKANADTKALVKQLNLTVLYNFF